MKIQLGHIYRFVGKLHSKDSITVLAIRLTDSEHAAYFIIIASTYSNNSPYQVGLVKHWAIGDFKKVNNLELEIYG